MKCPICGSTDVEVLSSSSLTRNVNTGEKGIFNKHTTTSFGINELLCLSCGAVTKAMKEEDLSNYVENKTQFVEKNWSY